MEQTTCSLLENFVNCDLEAADYGFIQMFMLCSQQTTKAS